MPIKKVPATGIKRKKSSVKTESKKVVKTAKRNSSCSRCENRRNRVRYSPFCMDCNLILFEVFKSMKYEEMLEYLTLRYDINESISVYERGNEEVKIRVIIYTEDGDEIENAKNLWIRED